MVSSTSGADPEGGGGGGIKGFLTSTTFLGIENYYFLPVKKILKTM